MIVPLQVFGADFTVLEDFNALSNGQLNGQNSWGIFDIGTNIEVGAGGAYEGAKGASRVTATNDDGYYKIISGEGSGIYSVYLRQTVTNKLLMLGLRTTTQPICRVGFNTDSTIDLQCGAGADLGAYSADTWYLVEIEVDDVADQVRARVNGGSWSSWVASENAFSGVNRIALITSGSATYQGDIDLIRYCAVDPCAPEEEPLATSTVLATQDNNVTWMLAIIIFMMGFMFWGFVINNLMPKEKYA